MPVYLLLLFSSFSLSYLGVNYKKNPTNFWTAPLILLFALIVTIVGFRDGVGTDFEGYREVYNALKYENAWRFEIGFRYMMQFFSDWGFDAWSMFLFSAIITWYFLFESFKDFPKILPWALFFTFTGGWFFSSLNGIRQIIAVSIFIYAFKYIRLKKIRSYVILLLFAALFHKSVLLMIPFYFFIEKLDFSSKKYLYAYIIAFPLASFVDLSTMISTGFEYVNVIFQLSIFETDHDYSVESLTQTYDNVYNSGLGLFFTYVFSALLIYTSQKFVNDKPQYLSYFNMFYLWAFLFLFTWHMSIFNRVLMYFIVFGIYCFGFVCYEYIRNAKMKYLVHILIFLQLLYFAYNISGSEYDFISLGIF